MTYSEPVPEHEWLRVEYCSPCSTETDHQWTEWRDEQLVTRECLGCGETCSYWDTV